MIVVKLQGGLGNQLFQVAFARGVQAKTGQNYLFDTTFLGTAKGVTPWPYMLQVMSFDVPLASEAQVRAFKAEKMAPKMTRLRKLFGARVPRYFTEEMKYVNAEAWNIVSDTYFDGYWQSESYFAHIKDDIRRTFTLRDPLGTEAERFKKMTAGEDTVSIHLRRGDYVEFKKVGDTLGVTGLEYVERALAEIQKTIPRPRLFIFSDDIGWVKENLRVPFDTTYVSGSGTAYYEEMMLISSCRHHILSNSTFSWWGAWFDGRPDKIVIAPKPWFKRENLESPDITPPSWIRIPMTQ